MRSLAIFFVLSINCFFDKNLSAQNADQNVFLSRAEKITKALSLPETEFSRVTKCVTDRYVKLNELQQWRDGQLKTLQQELGSDKTSFAAKKEEVVSTYELKVRKSHEQFVRRLHKMLDVAQVDKIKDGMTYSVAPNTMRAFQDMIPELTEAQRSKIWSWLVEARELAMDGESSEKKHAVFGKYKGRINNYLSSEGYDLKKAGEEWQKRLRATKTAK